MKKTILYSGWVGFGNHGDDACRDIFITRALETTAKKQITLDIKSIYPTNFNEYSLARLKPDLVVLGAGSLLEPVYLKPLVLAQQNSIPTAIWGSGYDSVNEAQLLLAQQQQPLDPSLVGPDSAYLIRQVVSKADIIGIRGPYTASLLASIGAHNDELVISGDPGLFLEPPTKGETLPELEQKTKPIISVNWGTAFNRIFGADEAKAAQALAKALSHLANDYQIIIYPVWEKDLKPCAELHALTENPASIICLDYVPTINQLITLYSNSVLSINMKLHASVFSAAIDCPFISLAYRWKNYDFTASLDLESLTISLSDEKLFPKILALTKELINDRPSYVTRIKKAKKLYQQTLNTLETKMLVLLTN